ncbi:hypothetical protein containing Invasin/intimin cell-adhesion domain [Alteracholeplasma palmae J233]|uniref:BIG2 domain-containing protein n=1 Tax=Alteracholeplasma palmae (strain ATCC 49389 / J233) TaxID=1318466 RepID=U4KKD7_ALTPJ|nr:Ig-like domain-containing protein [Alteracholeplasma palmae]CCV64179.1 hypothetical protein containing Invasin/intimin cell-adhesion domain [Alteracholeplasma palmae J233]
MKKIMSLLAIMILGIILVACSDKKIAVESITITSDKIYLNVNSTQELKVTVLPVDATNKALTFSIEDKTVATLDNNKVTGVKVGETKVTVSSVDKPELKKEIHIFVVSKTWPSAEIYDFSGFNLPEFINYTSVNVNKENLNSLTLEIKGIAKDLVDQSLNYYKEELIKQGWVVKTYDNHSGQLTHPSYNYYISMHNEFVHNGDTVELSIIKISDSEEHAHHHWDSIQTLVKTKFNIDLPDFIGSHEVEYKEVDNEITGTLELANRGENLNDFLETLIKEGFLKEEGSNDHAGTYEKDGLEFYYHLSHDNENIIQFKVSKHEHHHDHHHWDSIQTLVKTKFNLDLPDFIGSHEVEYKELDNEITGTVELANRGENLNDFLETLIKEGFLKEEGSNDHAGTYEKDGLKFYYHLSHDNANIIQFKVSKHEHHHDHYHWDSIQTLVKTKFNLDLPDFIGSHEVEYKELDNEITGTVELANRGENLNDFLETLIKEGFLKEEGSNDHAGTYEKDGLKFYYHLSHDNANIIQFKVSKHEHHHDHYHWDSIQTLVKTKFNLDLPDFIGSHEVEYKETDNEITGTVELANRHENLNDYGKLLIDLGFIADDKNNDHVGIYTKELVEFSYHVSHDNENYLDIKITTKKNTWEDVKNIVSEKFQITLSEFLDIKNTTLQVSENKVIFIIEVKNEVLESNLNTFLNSFDEKVWIKNENNDSHMGYLTKANEIQISYHNNKAHGQNTIEFEISSKVKATTTWPENELKAILGFELPKFEGYTALVFSNESKSITLKVSESLTEKVLAYVETLKSNGWTVFKENPYVTTLDSQNGTYRMFIRNGMVNSDQVDIILNEITK